MKKFLFLIAAVALLLASCTQLAKDNEKTVDVSISGRQVLASSGIDYYDDNIYDLYLRAFYYYDGNDDRIDYEEEEYEEPKPIASGKISELATRSYNLGEFEVGRKIIISSSIAKKIGDSEQWFWYNTESEPITIQKGITSISVKMRGEDKTYGNPLIVYKNFMPKTAYFRYNYYKGQHQVSSQFKFIFPDNQHSSINVGEKYTLTFSAKFQNFTGYYFNFCDKKFLEPEQGKGYLDYALSPTGAYGTLEVTNGEPGVKDGKISFTKTLLIEKDHNNPQDLVLDLTFQLAESDVPDDYKNKTEEELKDMSFMLALEDISASIVRSNVDIEEQIDSTALTVNQNVTATNRDWFYNEGIESNELSYTIDFLKPVNGRILQPQDVLTIELKGTIDAAITKSSVMQNFFYANILPRNFYNWSNDILSTYGASEDGNNATFTYNISGNSTEIYIKATISIDKFANSNLPDDAVLYLFFNTNEVGASVPSLTISEYNITSANINLIKN